MACDADFPDVATLSDEVLASAIILADQLHSEGKLDARLQSRRRDLLGELDYRMSRGIWRGSSDPDERAGA